jgi:predicted LPLAT superfamily acyltransferase
MLADRSLGDDATLECDFLGEPARFPLGPWRLAAMLRRPVFFMTGLYLGGNRYQLHFVPLADFSATPAGAREAAIADAVHRYADCLTQFCRQAPYNWFNFFDYWQQPK